MQHGSIAQVIFLQPAPPVLYGQTPSALAYSLSGDVRTVASLGVNAVDVNVLEPRWPAQRC